MYKRQPSTYKSVCPQLSQALELANSQIFSETYAGLSSIINEIFSSQNASIESLKKTFIEIVQGLDVYKRQPSMGIYFINDPDGYWIEIVPVR